MSLINAVRKVTRPFGIDIVRFENPKILTPPITTTVAIQPSEAIARVRANFPVEEPNENIRPLLLREGSQGLDLVEKLLVDHQCRVMLEIGSYLGGSAVHWAQIKKDLHVVCVDPWAGTWAAELVANAGYPEYRDQLLQQDGFYKTFLRNTNAYRQQIVPVRGGSPQVLTNLVLAGLEPDLIYVDARKVIDELIICSRLWPKAILTGDDWNWEPAKNFPMRQAVTKFASENGLKIEQYSDTWYVHK
jgi:Methyltransferase domain